MGYNGDEDALISQESLIQRMEQEVVPLLTFEESYEIDGEENEIPTCLYESYAILIHTIPYKESSYSVLDTNNNEIQEKRIQQMNSDLKQHIKTIKTFQNDINKYNEFISANARLLYFDFYLINDVFQRFDDETDREFYFRRLLDLLKEGLEKIKKSSGIKIQIYFSTRHSIKKLLIIVPTFIKTLKSIDLQPNLAFVKSEISDILSQLIKIAQNFSINPIISDAKTFENLYQIRETFSEFLSFAPNIEFEFPQSPIMAQGSSILYHIDRILSLYSALPKYPSTPFSIYNSCNTIIDSSTEIFLFSYDQVIPRHFVAPFGIFKDFIDNVFSRSFKSTLAINEPIDQVLAFFNSNYDKFMTIIEIIMKYFRSSKLDDYAQKFEIYYQFLINNIAKLNWNQNGDKTEYYFEIEDKEYDKEINEILCNIKEENSDEILIITVTEGLKFFLNDNIEAKFIPRQHEIPKFIKQKDYQLNKVFKKSLNKFEKIFSILSEIDIYSVSSKPVITACYNELINQSFYIDCLRECESITDKDKIIKKFIEDIKLLNKKNNDFQKYLETVLPVPTTQEIIENIIFLTDLILDETKQFETDKSKQMTQYFSDFKDKISELTIDIVIIDSMEMIDNAINDVSEFLEYAPKFDKVSRNVNLKKHMNILIEYLSQIYDYGQYFDKNKSYKINEVLSDLLTCEKDIYNSIFSCMNSSNGYKAINVSNFLSRVVCTVAMIRQNLWNKPKTLIKHLDNLRKQLDHLSGLIKICGYNGGSDIIRSISNAWWKLLHLKSDYKNDKKINEKLKEIQETYVKIIEKVSDEDDKTYEMTYNLRKSQFDTIKCIWAPYSPRYGNEAETSIENMVKEIEEITNIMGRPDKYKIKENVEQIRILYNEAIELLGGEKVELKEIKMSPLTEFVDTYLYKYLEDVFPFAKLSKKLFALARQIINKPPTKAKLDDLQEIVDDYMIDYKNSLDELILTTLLIFAVFYQMKKDIHQECINFVRDPSGKNLIILSNLIHEANDKEKLTNSDKKLHYKLIKHYLVPNHSMLPGIVYFTSLMKESAFIDILNNLELVCHSKRHVELIDFTSGLSKLFEITLNDPKIPYEVILFNDNNQILFAGTKEAKASDKCILEMCGTVDDPEYFDEADENEIIKEIKKISKLINLFEGSTNSIMMKLLIQHIDSQIHSLNYSLPKNENVQRRFAKLLENYESFAKQVMICGNPIRKIKFSNRQIVRQIHSNLLIISQNEIPKKWRRFINHSLKSFSELLESPDSLRFLFSLDYLNKFKGGIDALNIQIKSKSAQRIEENMTELLSRLSTYEYQQISIDQVSSRLIKCQNISKSIIEIINKEGWTMKHPFTEAIIEELNSNIELLDLTINNDTREEAVRIDLILKRIQQRMESLPLVLFHFNCTDKGIDLVNEIMKARWELRNLEKSSEFNLKTFQNCLNLNVFDFTEYSKYDKSMAKELKKYTVEIKLLNEYTLSFLSNNSERRRETSYFLKTIYDIIDDQISIFKIAIPKSLRILDNLSFSIAYSGFTEEMILLDNT